MSEPPRKLTLKQRRFVEAYDGNGTKAARLAGYRGNNNTLAQVARDNLRLPYIQAALAEREKLVTTPLVACREYRQEFWAKMMEQEKSPLVRLRASELLAKSQGDFVERHRLEGADGGPLAIQIVLGDNGRGQS